MTLRVRSLVAGLFILLVVSACSTAGRDATRTAVAATGVGLNHERFEVTFSGDIDEDSATPGFATYWFMQDTDAYQLLLQDGDSIYRIAFLIPRGVQAGEHPIVATVLRPQDLVGINVAVVGEARTAPFTVNVSGTLMLTADIGQTPISGSFTFTAENTDEQRITVTGTFTDVIRTD